MTMRMVLVMMVMILNQNGWNGDSWRMFCLLQQLYKSAFTLNFIRVPWLECKQCNKCGFFYNLGFWQLLVKILSSLSIEREKWEIRSRLSAFDSDKQFRKLITKPTMRCTGYQPSKELFWGKNGLNLIYRGKHPDMLKFESLCSERQQSDLRVLCFEAGDQTISQGGQVRLSRLPTEDVMVVRQRTNPTKWKGLF